MATVDEALAALEAEVTRDKTVNGSATALILRIAALYEAAKNAPAKIQALTDMLRANSDSLAADVVTNTPADVPPVEPPPA